MEGTGADTEQYQSCAEAAAHEVIPMERERYKSIYDANAD